MAKDSQNFWDNNWQPPDTSFVPLMFLHKTPTASLTSDYIIKGADGETKRVTAPTALAAILESGIDTPIRVKRIAGGHHDVFDPGELADDKPAAETEPPAASEAAETAPQAETSSEETPADEAPAEEPAPESETEPEPEPEA